MDTHPYNAPLAYVKPTSDMQIKVSMYVDYNGKIYLPYLHDWNPVSVTLSFTFETNVNCPKNRFQMRLFTVTIRTIGSYSSDDCNIR